VKTVLFVDDHEVLARLSCEILEMQGYRAISAYNAADALAKLAHQKIDILVTDWKMEGMDGLELARTVHERDPSIPVIIVTSYAPIDTGTEVAAWLPKVELFPSLVDKIEFLLGKAESDEDEEEIAPARRA
jgi:CheY-like chemotaxis protein